MLMRNPVLNRYSVSIRLQSGGCHATAPRNSAVTRLTAQNPSRRFRRFSVSCWSALRILGQYPVPYRVVASAMFYPSPCRSSTCALRPRTARNPSYPQIASGEVVLH